MSETPLEVVAESIPHIVWLADASGSTDYFNERGTDYTGLPPHANYGWGWVELVHPDDAERARLGWEHATRTATPFELSYRIRHRDGEFRWHAFRALPVRGHAGDVTRWIGTADDITAVYDGAGDETRVECQIAELRSMLAVVQPSPRDRFGYVDAECLAHRTGEALRDSDGGVPGPATVDLAPRDLAVARLVGSGHTNREIANLLGYSLRTIEARRAHLRVAHGLATRADLVRFVREHDLDVQA